MKKKIQHKRFTEKLYGQHNNVKINQTVGTF